MMQNSHFRQGSDCVSRVDRALMLNKVQKVPHYRRLSGGRRWGLLFLIQAASIGKETVTGLLLRTDSSGQAVLPFREPSITVVFRSPGTS